MATLQSSLRKLLVMKSVDESEAEIIAINVVELYKKWLADRYVCRVLPMIKELEHVGLSVWEYVHLADHLLMELYKKRLISDDDWSIMQHYVTLSTDIGYLFPLSSSGLSLYFNQFQKVRQHLNTLRE